MIKFGLSTYLVANEGKSSDLFKAMRIASKLALKQSGCRIYSVGQSTRDGNIIHVYEVWDSKEDHKNSLEDQEIRDLIDQTKELINFEEVKSEPLSIYLE